MSLLYRMIAVMAFVAAAMTATAQTGLAVDRFFSDEFQRRSDVTAVTVDKSSLKGSKMSLYRSVTVDGDPAQVDEMRRCAASDGARAETKEVSMSGGKLRYGFYTLRPTDGNIHRYLFFLDKSVPGGGGDAAMVVYIEGRLTAEELKKMLLK